MSHRTQLLNVLNTHPTTDAKEAEDATRMQAFVAAHPDCFGEANPLGHITGSAFIFDPAGRILLTHHRKLQRWLQLGGHSEVHEHDPLHTALREGLEESGLHDLKPCSRRPVDIDIHQIPARRERLAHDHHDVRYALMTTQPDAINLTEESTDLRWFTLADTLNLDLDPAMRRGLAKAHAAFLNSGG